MFRRMLLLFIIIEICAIICNTIIKIIEIIKGLIKVYKKFLEMKKEMGIFIWRIRRKLFKF